MWKQPLSLALLGGYLIEFCNGQVQGRYEIRELATEHTDSGLRAKELLRNHLLMFQGKPESEILAALAFFRGPAQLEAIKLLIPEISTMRYKAALQRLRRSRLLLVDPSGVGPLDCSRLVRDFLASSFRSTRAAPFRRVHLLLARHYSSRQIPELPDILEVQTLCEAVYHAAEAGHYKMALRLFQRIQGSNTHLAKSLGAFGEMLSLLANFFQEPWHRVVPVFKYRT